MSSAIKVEELRVGNYLQWEDQFGKNIDQISQILTGSVTFQNSGAFHDIKGLKPIPLTEEWLVKLGFEFKDFFWQKFVHEEEDNFVGALHNIGFAYYVNINDDKPLIYVYSVHQLQNLYFALTGEELIIK